MIKIRNFTLYQKAVLVNSLIASKLWYVAHAGRYFKNCVTQYSQRKKLVFTIYRGA